MKGPSRCERRRAEKEEKPGAKGGITAGKEFFLAAINKFLGSLTMIQLEHPCPGVSRDMIRLVLRRLQKKGQAECLGRSPGAS
jgi:hypothetical protein